jgi:hypothetical protein
MRSECIAAVPPSVSSYTWKAVSSSRTRPYPLDSAKDRISRRERRFQRSAPKAEHPSLPWKAYLASRELQNLASDLTDAVFGPSTSVKAPDLSRPAILMLDAKDSADALCEASNRLRAPIMPQAEGSIAAENGSPYREPAGLTIAA